MSWGLAWTREGAVERLYSSSLFCCLPARSFPVLPSLYLAPRHLLARLSIPSPLHPHSSLFLKSHSELAKNGHLHEMHVCDNVGDHLQGNVYARYEWEAEASRAVQDLNTRWYAGKPLYAELSPVTDFKEACCRQNEMGECTRGG